MASKREQELEAIVRALVPAARDILWCALVWNDHNFDDKDLRDKAERAAKALGYERNGHMRFHNRTEDPIDKVNAWLERVDKALGPVPQRGGNDRG